MNSSRSQRHYTTKGDPSLHARHIARTWQIDKSVSEDINRLATELECYPSDLVNMLLQRGVDALQNGEWTITRTPYKYTLHWGIDPSNQNQT